LQTNGIQKRVEEIPELSEDWRNRMAVDKEENRILSTRKNGLARERTRIAC